MTAPRPIFLTPKAVASRLNVNVKTVYRLVEGKKLRAYRIGQGLRISQDDFLTFLRDSEVKP